MVVFEMKMERILSVALGLMLASMAQAQTPATLERAERIGHQLYQLDHGLRAARVAGEDKRAFRRSDEITGWVAGQRDGDFWFTFVGESKKKGAMGLFQIGISPAGTPLEAMQRLDEESLDGELATQYLARKLAEAVPHKSCASQNEVLLLSEPTASGVVWQAYVLPQSTFADVLMLGGSQRITVSADGSTVQSNVALGGEACAVVQNPADAASLQVRDGTENGPNELHVYMSLLTGKPLYVVSGERSWLIQDGRIRQAASAG